MRIIGIAGSLRKSSFNKALLEAAKARMPAGSTLEIESFADFPIYDGDIEEARGVPAPVAALKDKVAASDGLLIATPEYNGSIPGPLKNAIDWMTRPPDDIDRVFGGRPMGIMGATPGVGGTRLAQNAWLSVIRQLGARPFFGRSLYVASAGSVFDSALKLTDARTEKALTTYLGEFLTFAQQGR